MVIVVLFVSFVDKYLNDMAHYGGIIPLRYGPEYGVEFWLDFIVWILSKHDA